MTHFRIAVKTIQLETIKAPQIDHISGISLNIINCHRKANAISVVALTTETGPACSSCNERVRRICPQKANTESTTIKYHSNRFRGIEKPSRTNVIIVVSSMATQPKLNIITA